MLLGFHVRSEPERQKLVCSSVIDNALARPQRVVVGWAEGESLTRSGLSIECNDGIKRSLARATELTRAHPNKSSY
jgi:hypothetical protein